jgi:nucleoside-diphosphate-sugar epimerase
MASHRVLVTGSSGFLGRALVRRLLTNGCHVAGLDPAPPRMVGYRHLDDDLSNASRLRTHLAAERPTHIIHAGGVSGPMVLSENPDRVMTINVGGTLNLLFAALDSGVRTFIYCSSVSAVGNYYETTPIGEDYPLRPTTTYGCSKAAVDMVLRGLWGRVGLDLCSLRFTSIYGAGRQTSFVIDDIVTAAVDNRPVRVPPTGDWPYIHVDDAADATIAACFSGSRRQLVYFLAYPEQVSVHDLAAAAGSARLEIDNEQPQVSRGPVDIGPAVRDFGFAPKIDHRLGIGRMIAPRKGGR